MIGSAVRSQRIGGEKRASRLIASCLFHQVFLLQPQLKELQAYKDIGTYVSYQPIIGSAVLLGMPHIWTPGMVSWDGNYGATVSGQ